MATEMNEDLSRLSSASKRLTDEELIVRLTQCIARGRHWEARILVHMSEVDARKLYRDQGYSSTAFPEAPTAELPRVLPVTGMANHPLAAVREPATENAEHSFPGAAGSGSVPAAGSIVEPTLATHRPDGAIAPSGSAPAGITAQGGWGVSALRT
jgi:hypothetical protein